MDILTYPRFFDQSLLNVGAVHELESYEHSKNVIPQSVVLGGKRQTMPPAASSIIYSTTSRYISSVRCRLALDVCH